MKPGCTKPGLGPSLNPGFSCTHHRLHKPGLRKPRFTIVCANDTNWHISRTQCCDHGPIMVCVCILTKRFLGKFGCHVSSRPPSDNICYLLFGITGNLLINGINLFYWRICQHHHHWGMKRQHLHFYAHWTVVVDVCGTTCVLIICSTLIGQYLFNGQTNE